MAYYLSPTGNDSNDGLSLGNAWRNVSKLNSVSAAFAVRTTVYIYGTMAAPFYADARLDVSNLMDVIGVGDASFTVKQSTTTGNYLHWTDVTITGCCDYRAYKVVTGTWTVDGTYGNVWSNADAEAGTVLWKCVGWSSGTTSYTQPLIQLAHANTVSAAAVNTAGANSFASNGTTNYIYSTTNPNSDGSLWVRSRPAFGNAISVGDAGTVTNLAVGGMAYVSADGTDSGQAYVVNYTATVDNLQATPFTNVLIYQGGKHTLGLEYAASMVKGTVVTISNTVRVEGVQAGAGWTSYAAYPTVAYADGATCRNNVVVFNQTQMTVKGVVGSTEGATDSALPSISAHNALDGTHFSEIRIGGYINGNLDFSGVGAAHRGYGRITGVNCRVTGVIECNVDSSWDRCWFNAPPAVTVAGKSTSVRCCRIIPGGERLYNDGVSIQGYYEVIGCGLDSRNMYESGGNPSFFNRTGALHFVYQNNWHAEVWAGSGVPLVVKNMNINTGDVLESDGNVWCTANQTTTMLWDIDGTNTGLGINLAATQALGYDANSVWVGASTGVIHGETGAMSTLGVDANMIPQTGSPLLQQAIGRYNEGDLSNRVFPVSCDVGPYQVTQAASGLYEIPAPFAPLVGSTTWTEAGRSLTG